MGNVYMRADQISYKDGTVKDALDKGGGGGSTSAADVSYDGTSSSLSADNVQAAIDEVAGEINDLTAAVISYDNTSSGLTADNVQAAIDEVVGDVGDNSTAISTLSGDIDDIESGLVYSESEVAVGKWGTSTLYRKVLTTGALPNTSISSFNTGLNTEVVRRIDAYYTNSDEYGPIPNNESTLSYNKATKKIDIATSSDYSSYTGVVIIEYTKE